MNKTRARVGRRRLVLGSLLVAVVAVVCPMATAVAAPPDNDAIAAAAPITALPLVTTVDLTEATFEPGEPGNCGFTGPTVWYHLTPTSNMFLTAQATGATATSVYVQIS